MELLLGILLGILWIGGIIFMRSITTLFHEMGHAIPALVYTKKEQVQVFVGTYGDLSNCVQLNFGRLILFLKLNLFNWRLGLCRHGQVKGFLPQLIIILGGPLASLIIATIAFYFIFTQNWSQGWIVFSVFFLISAIIDFLVNVDPSHTPIKLYDNTITYSDGYQLVNVLKERNLPTPYFEAKKLLFEKQPEKAIAICLGLIDIGSQKKPVYDLIIKGYLDQKKYQAALDFFQSFKTIHKFSYLDFYQLGYINLQLNRWEAALPYFDHCIYQKHKDALALNHRGYIRLQTGDYQGAMQDLEAAVAYASDFGEAWSNRGLLKVKMGEKNAGFKDMEYALQLDSSNAKIYYHLGLYFESIGNYKIALSNFKQAKSLNINFHGIDLKIAEMERNMD